MVNPLASRVRVVLDTDTYNEVDDQFALTHLLLAPEKVSLEAVYAAPFHNQRTSSPADGMEKSYEEIIRVFEQVAPTERPPAFRGSTTYLSGAHTPVESEAVVDLIERALDVRAGKLFVLGIAAATNLASALLIEPRIAGNVEVVWLGGHAPYWPDTHEFNLRQDPHAARVLLDHDVPLVLLPCMGVTSHLITTVAELDAHLAPFSNIGRYLTDIVRNYAGNPPGWAKVIWDIAASAYVLIPGAFTMADAPSPVLGDMVWETPPPTRRRIRIAREVSRNSVFTDFFARARGHGR